MTDILNWLEEETEPANMLPEFRRLIDLLPEQNDAIMDALTALSNAETQEAFSRGFRLGVQLFSAAILAK